jgi:peptide/nickel transport system substrate-binding protein
VNRIAGVLAAICALTAVTACQQDGPAAPPGPATGGTLNVILSSRAVGNLDPQEISWATDANIGRLIDRTLTTTRPDGTLVADLATDTGRPSENNTVWDFQLKTGVRWSDGTAVTCDDIKYGIERRYAKTVSDAGGLPYPLLYLKDNATPYTGPYGGAKLDSIVCTDQRTVQFHLQRPVGDFNYTVSVNTFAPVKVGADRTTHTMDTALRADSFQLSPISDGPYRVDPSQTRIEKINGRATVTNLLLVRNDYWDRRTDPVRAAYPEQISFQFRPDSAGVTNDLINSVGVARNAINLDQNVAPNFVQQVINDPGLSARAAAGPAGGTTYFAINVRNVPKLACRAALQYAFDRRAWRVVLGGSAAGDLATTMIPPSLAAHPHADPFGVANFPDGDEDTAKKLMKQGGCASTITAAYPDVPIYHQLINTVVDAYARIGVNVVALALNTQSQDYINKIAAADNPYDMIYSGWVPDWPSASAMIPPLFSGAQTHGPAEQNLDFAQLDDKSVNDAIDTAYGESVPTAQNQLWAAVDLRVVKDLAAVIPIVYPHALRMMGTNVRGATISTAYGEPDLAVLGLGPAEGV